VCYISGGLLACFLLKILSSNVSFKLLTPLFDGFHLQTIKKKCKSPVTTLDPSGGLGVVIRRSLNKLQVGLWGQA